MRQLILTIIISLLPAYVAIAQNNHDDCHVYVIDVLKARKAYENFHETGDKEVDAKALSEGVTVVGRFKTEVGEEELTTKTYRFPGSKLFITASVFYTDEMMASSEGSDSMLVGVAVSDKGEKNAIIAPNNAVAEVTLNDHTDTVRTKKTITVNGRSYLVGVECHCKEKAAAELE